MKKQFVEFKNKIRDIYSNLFAKFRICPRASVIDDLERIVIAGVANKYFPSQASRRCVVNFLNLESFRKNKKIKNSIKNNFIDRHVSLFFLLFYIILPVFFTILLYFLRNTCPFNRPYNGDPETLCGDNVLTIFNQIVYPLILVVMMIFLWTFSWTFRDRLRLSGLFFIIWAISFWLFLPFIAAFLAELFNIDKKSEIKFAVFSITLQSILYIALLGVYFWKFYIWRASFIFQILNNPVLILTWTSCGIAAGFFLNYLIHFFTLQSGSIFYNIFNFLNIGDSVNQKILKKIFNHSLYGKIIIFLQSICLAPFIEELACREGLFRISKTKNNGLLIWLCSFLFFSNMHVMNGTMKNISEITGYFGLSIVLSTIFLIKQNTAYTIPVHLGNNLLAFMLLLF